HDPREQSFSETETYQWDVFISAEEIAKGNQEKIRAMVGFPADAKLVSVDVSLPQAYDRFLQKELAKLVKVTQPETPKTPKPEKNWWDIGLGALQVVGGAAEAVGGAALAIFTAPTVAGALAGSYMIVDGYYNMKAGINQMRNGFIGEKRYDTTHGLEEAFASLGAMTGHETLGRGTYYAVSILNPLSVSGKINSGVNISKAVTSTTKSLKAVDTATKEAPLLRMDLQTFAKNPSDDLVAKGTGNSSKWSSDKGIYSVAYEVNLPKDMYPNVSSPRHFQNANEQLYNAFQKDSKFAQQMEGLYPGINKGVQAGSRGKFSRNAPTKEVTWHHHADREGVLQLVPRNQHQAKGPIQQILHPGGRGGMENWGGGR
uniref:HNH endonuclease n=1 Tax=Cytobacillus oceanisediminis TaxID=665099 RepID=UPI0011A1E89A